MSFCDNCGSKLNDDSKYCSNCGYSNDTASSGSTMRKTVYDGEIHKCPHCGEVLKSFSIECPACGCELRNVTNSKVVREFEQKLSEATYYSQRLSIIKSFPVPNTKEDIFEFMILACSQFDAAIYSSHLDEEDESDAWLSKIEQCYQKANIIITNSDDFKQINEMYQAVLNNIEQNKIRLTDKEKQKNNKKTTKIVLIASACILVPLLIWLTVWLVQLNNKGGINSNPNAVSVGLDSRDIEGQNYIYIIELLSKKGFVNIETVDAGWNSQYNVGDVKDIIIDGKNSFYDVTKFDINSKVVIYYISEPKTIQMNTSYDDLLGQDYRDVKDMLEAKGFSNIECREDGWNLFHKSETVKRIMFNGEEGFFYTDEFKENVKIVILYYK